MKIQIHEQDHRFSVELIAGFMNPEGIVVWHEAARVMFKKTIEKDTEHKT